MLFGDFGTRNDAVTGQAAPHDLKQPSATTTDPTPAFMTRYRLLLCLLLAFKPVVEPREAVVDQAEQPWRVAASSSSAPTEQQNASRRLVEGLACDVTLYEDFLASDEGQSIFIMATMCESRIVYLKTSRAGAYGPIEQADLRSAMCSDECLKSDELHQLAMSTSRCTCAELSADTFVRHDFCLDNSARLLCSHLGECGHWGCELEDFMCQRYEWDRLYACAASCNARGVLIVLAAVATGMLLL